MGQGPPHPFQCSTIKGHQGTGSFASGWSSGNLSGFLEPQRVGTNPESKRPLNQPLGFLPRLHRFCPAICAVEVTPLLPRLPKNQAAFWEVCQNVTSLGLRGIFQGLDFIHSRAGEAEPARRHPAARKTRERQDRGTDVFHKQRSQQRVGNWSTSGWQIYTYIYICCH